MELVKHPDVEQGGVHRLDRGRQDDRPCRGRVAQEADPGAGRQGGQHRLRRRAAGPGHRGHHQRHLLQPGRGVLRRLAAVRAGERLRAAARQAQGPARHPARRRPAGQEHRCRRHQLRRAAGQDHRAGASRASTEGAEIFQPECQLPDRGFFFRPTLFTGVSQSHRIAQEEIFGPVLSVLTFRTPEEAIEKANNTPYGLSAGVWTEKGSRIFKMVSAMRAGVVWANTFNRFDPPRRSAATRSPATAARAACTAWPRTSTCRRTGRPADEPWTGRPSSSWIALRTASKRPGNRSTSRRSTTPCCAWRASRGPSPGTTTTRTSSSCAGAAPSASSWRGGRRCTWRPGELVRRGARPAASAGGGGRAGLRAADRAAGDEAVRRGGGRLMPARRRTATKPAVTRRASVLDEREAAAAGHRPTAPARRRADRRAQDVQALHRRPVPAHRVGPRLRDRDARAALLANACRGTRKDIREAVRAARKALPGLGGQDRLQPQPDPVPHRGADGGPARPVHGRGDGRGGGRPPPRDAAGGCGHRPLGLVRRLGGQVLARCSAP